MNVQRTGRQQRRILGFFPDPKLQIKYGVFNAVFVSFFIFCSHLIVVLKLQGMAQDDPALFVENSVLFTLIEFMRSSSYIIAGVAFVFTFISTVLIMYRFSGPAIAITNYIDDMIKGPVTRKLTFRENDELEEIATKLNQLQEKLSQKN